MRYYFALYAHSLFYLSPLDVCKGKSGKSGKSAPTFETRCVASALSENGIDYSSNPSDSFVDCNDGFVKDTNGITTDQTCSDACGDKCCTGTFACGRISSATSIVGGFTGKGE